MKNRIKKIIAEALRKSGVQTYISFDVETTKEENFGDYATNAAFNAAKELKRSPIEIASELKKYIDNAKHPFIEKTEVAGNGFLNFFIKDNFWLEEFKKLSLNPAKYIFPKTAKKEKIKIEVISANPTGPLTMANGRGGFFADALANILEKFGYKITREYYVNDRGNQIKILGESVLAALGAIPQKEEHYQGEYIKKIAKIRVATKLKTDEIGVWAVKYILKNFIQKSIKKAGIKVNNYFYESSLYAKKWDAKAFAILKEKNLVYESEGATWLKTKNRGDERDRVLLRSDGTATYLASDAAYILENIAKRSFNIVINPLGADHYGSKKSLEILAYEISPKTKYVVIIMQYVTLAKESEKIRMSKRKGEFITLDALIDEVGLDAARYFFIERHPNTHINFDIALAKERNEKNPVYYIQYAHARMASIIRNSKLKTQNSKLQPKIKNYNMLTRPGELKLIKKILQLPDVLEKIKETYEVNILPAYTLELAKIFSEFYRDVPVIKSEPELRAARLALTAATQKVFKEILGLMGIKAPKRM